MQKAHERSAAERGRVRLLFLDGLRGFSALYVVVFHATQSIDANHQPTPLAGAWQWIYNGLNYGHWAVAVFIVLSGYCLMLPVARSSGLSVPGGVKSYLFRRARRILPPYYAALIGSLLLIATIPMLQHPGVDRWMVALPALEAGPILSHLFMIHCFGPEWEGRIDPPMWSVAVEWWIYFLFPWVLLPLWRRFGTYGALAIVAVLGIGPHWIFQQTADQFCPWYFTLFGFGAVAAHIAFSPAAERERRWNWALIAAMTCIFAIGMLALGRGFCLARIYLSDPIVGLGVASLTVWCSLSACNPSSLNLVLRVLESRVVVFLGTISYSVYLLHAPLIPLFSIPLRGTGWSPETRLALSLAVGTPLILVASYLFHRIFERPFMVGHPKSPIKAAVSAAIEPAP